MVVYKSIPFIILMISVCSSPVTAKDIHNYVFFGRDRERIKEETFLKTTGFEGAQLKYTWKELEPTKNNYNLSLIMNDLEFLNARGKKLFIQIQDVSFDLDIINVPEYLRNEPEYGGGADIAYQFEDEEETKAIPEGWVARRWDPKVRERFQLLLAVLGEKLDGNIEGINLPETAVEFGNKGDYHPKGFTFEIYRDSLLDTMKALKDAFPNTVVIQYANFMPGEWLPWEDHSYLKSVYDYAKDSNVGVGGPDLLPFRKGQLNNSYPFIRQSAGIVPTGVAVQWGNYEDTNPETGERISISEIFEFGKDNLKLDYIFWGTQEPFYTENVIPFLESMY